ncbi:hypothetical protein NEAUS03_1728 [Nematocida ausubeli]|nr:hypothetical protein NEAUS03_1728 [Nematocida ausubeli]
MERLSVVEYLAMRYLNERESKRLLPYDEDLMDRVKFLLHRQKKRQREEAQRNRIKEHIYKIEADRIEWLISEYLLMRLEKIRNDFYIEDLSLLSPYEKTYYQEYINLNKEAGTYTELEQIPARHRHPKDPAEIHGVYILDDVQDVLIGEEILTLQAGEFLIGDIAGSQDLVNDLGVLLI